MDDTEAQFSEAKDRLASLLNLAKNIRDNLNHQVLTDEMYETAESLSQANDRVAKIQHELEWTVKQVRGS